MPLPSHAYTASTDHDPDAVRIFRGYALLVAWITLLVSLLTLFGWLSGSAALAGLLLGLPPMHGVTACAFVVVAATLLAIGQDRRWNIHFCRFAALILGALAAANLAEHLGLVDLGFAHWVLTPRDAPLPARMPVMSSLVFILFSLRTLAFGLPGRAWLGDALSVLLLGASMVALATLGISVAKGEPVGSSLVTPVAAVLLFANSLAWIAIRPQSPLGRISVARGIGGSFARRLLLPALLLPMVYAWLLQWARSYSGLDDAWLIALSAVVTGGSVASLVWYVAASSERAQQQRAHVRRLTDVARTDVLTGLHNRRSFDETLAQLLQRRRESDRNFCVLMLDLDHFKSYNDSFGHPAGDEALRRVGALLPRGLRPDDLAARYGGEEFVVLLADCIESAALQTAERIRRMFVAENWPHRPITVSIGLTQARAEDDAQTLVARADGALYAAKQQGRDRVVSADRPAET